MINYRSILLILGICFLMQIPNNVKAQKVGTWVFGYNFPRLDSNQLDTGIYYIVGTNLLEFNPLNYQRYFKALSFNYNVTNMWDKQGNLQFYCNGSKIFNYEHKLMGGG